MTTLSVEELDSIAARERRELVSDLFHGLNQPLTTLRCSLELALAKPRTGEQYRKILSRGIEDAEQVAWFSTGIRELLEADDPGDECQTLALSGSLQEVVRDLLPLAELAGVKLSCNCISSYEIRFEPQRFRQALFRVLELGLETSRGGTVANIRLSECEGEAVLALNFASEPASHRVSISPQADLDVRSRSLDGARSEHPPRELANRLRMAIARALVEAAGGAFQISVSRECLSIVIRLPLVRS